MEMETRRAAAEADRAAAETRLAAAETERRAVEIEDAARLSPRERAVRRVARMILAAGADADHRPDGRGCHPIRMLRKPRP
ncbi:hypothetical protein [Streptomyces sp. NRRL F-5065]|uniref:hypothetical protein n=1 Tax=Streptomyces sp. NRRL F-5065 TaxID=1463855 RepID=UPI0004BFB5B9|nr:hypothetical protein [Streptomyces sp. NRRL F-5065]